MAVTLDETVRWLDIPVQDARSGRGLQTRDNLQDSVYSLGYSQRSFGLQSVLQCSPGHKFHRDHGDSLNLFRAVDIHAMGMADGSRQTPFAKKPGLVNRLSHGLTEDLQRDATAAFQILGLIDFAHTPFAEPAH